MAGQHDPDIIKKLVEGEPQVISTSAAGVSISVHPVGDAEHEYIYPDTTPSDVITAHTAADLGITLPPDQQNQVVQSIEEVRKTYFKEIKVAVKVAGLGSVEFGVKRVPKTTIKVYSKKT